MCTLTKDINFLCPSKPFVCDNTEGICGLESIRPDSSFPTEATSHSQVKVTQAKIIGNRWLVNTPARTDNIHHTITYGVYYCFFCIFDQINAGLGSRREFFKKKNIKTLTTQKLLTGNLYYLFSNFLNKTTGSLLLRLKLTIYLYTSSY